MSLKRVSGTILSFVVFILRPRLMPIPRYDSILSVPFEDKFTVVRIPGTRSRVMVQPSQLHGGDQQMQTMQVSNLQDKRSDEAHKSSGSQLTIFQILDARWRVMVISPNLRSLNHQAMPRQGRTTSHTERTHSAP